MISTAIKPIVAHLVPLVFLSGLVSLVQGHDECSEFGLVSFVNYELVCQDSLGGSIGEHGFPENGDPRCTVKASESCVDPDSLPQPQPVVTLSGNQGPRHDSIVFPDQKRQRPFTSMFASSGKKTQSANVQRAPRPRPSVPAFPWQPKAERNFEKILVFRPTFAFTNED